MKPNITDKSEKDTKKTSLSYPKLKEEIARALEIVRKGGIILYPTDTVWGIGCDATNTKAVERVYEIKKRQDSKALITLVDSEAMLERYVEEVPEVAYQLMEAAVRPLTIVYDKGINLSPKLLADDGSIGIRVSNEDFSNGLVKAMRKPLVSTSANISGEPTPASFGDISAEIRDAVDYVVDYGRTRNGSVPSNVIKLSASGEVKIIR